MRPFREFCKYQRSWDYRRFRRHKIQGKFSSLPPLSKIIHKHHSVMVESDEERGRCFMEPSLVSYMRSKNIKDHLIRAKVSTTRHSKMTYQWLQGLWILVYYVCTKPYPNTNATNLVNKGQLVRNCIYKLVCKKSKCKDWFYDGESECRCKNHLYNHKS